MSLDIDGSDRYNIASYFATWLNAVFYLIKVRDLLIIHIKQIKEDTQLVSRIIGVTVSILLDL
ncbi:hypothetical protein PVK64_09645 [Aliivibrio sp. S4TY2]|uniref:Uncharacterized protein n=1 Tax=Aliivibrio finisterrensis TaxID=511998 RepID=A0A4Q5KLB1_9GAMM|nr:MULTISPECIES: hypothetical protein [Aliivibrio]KAB2824055.1 hypothetical protein F8B77_12655 [Aliivibrio finisterrensis]MDD9156449.1 hypothetical protein [Aliivibrio sp. S4TY2]MDD9160114.1 hypothetical protein [Aliivibrio sp. S4TY1]MDD9164336.1 hypothetical protein [Aliivibrio sp. S4MY2]MDD9168156.1 hypothetical protein [Aliivibrio sp. S4MY4]